MAFLVGDAMRFKQLNESWVCTSTGVRGAVLRQRVHVKRNDFARTKSLIRQALDQPELGQIVCAVDAFTMRITSRFGKVRAAFSHAKGVFGDADIALHSRNSDGPDTAKIIHPHIFVLEKS